MSDNEHSGNEMEQDEHVDDLAEDEEAPQAVVKSGIHKFTCILNLVYLLIESINFSENTQAYKC